MGGGAATSIARKTASSASGRWRSQGYVSARSAAVDPHVRTTLGTSATIASVAEETRGAAVDGEGEGTPDASQLVGAREGPAHGGDADVADVGNRPAQLANGFEVATRSAAIQMKVRNVEAETGPLLVRRSLQKPIGDRGAEDAAASAMPIGETA